MALVLAKIESSNIESFGYEVQNSLLGISFKSGGLYFYFGVPKNIFEALQQANSKGSYFSQNIKDRYQFTKVELVK